MKDIIADLYNKFDPIIPATSSEYVHSSEARGRGDIVKSFQDEITKVAKEKYLCFLFSGHLGCGKSSELYHLAEKLKNPDSSGQRCFFPIIVNVDDYLDDYDVQPVDVMLAVIAEVSQQFGKIGIELKDTFLSKILNGFNNLFFSRIELDNAQVEIPLPLSKVTAKFTILKRDSVNREKVREALLSDYSTLRDEINTVLNKARIELLKKKFNGKQYSDFVIIIDNLEKIERIKEFPEGFISQKEFFIERAAQLTGLKSHIIYTVPLPLILSNGSQLEKRYASTPYVLPMIKIEDRNHNPFQKGYDTLKNIFINRIPKDLSFESVIEIEAFNFLVKYSGGNTREFVMFVRKAFSSADKLPLTLSDAENSIGDTISLYARLSRAQLDKLASLHISPDQNTDTSDDVVKDLLKQLMILEYRNGDNNDDKFNPNTPWYAVHPLIRELRIFKSAVKEKETAVEKDKSK